MFVLQALQAARLQAEASTPLAGPGADAAAAEEVARLQAEADEQRQEFGDLLACLGQESAKVNALQQLLAEQGIDASALLAQVLTRSGFHRSSHCAAIPCVVIVRCILSW